MAKKKIIQLNRITNIGDKDLIIVQKADDTDTCAVTYENLIAAAASTSIRIDLDDKVGLSIGKDLVVPITFKTTKPGSGTLHVVINDEEVINDVSINQAGVNKVTLESKYFSQGINKVSFFVVDQDGIYSNTINIRVTYGGLELSTDFDSETQYEMGSTIRMYFQPKSTLEGEKLTFHMVLNDGDEETIECISGTRGVYTFNNTLGAGSYNAHCWLTDKNNEQSNHLYFNLIVIGGDNLVVASSVSSAITEEGYKVSLDYRVGKKGETQFNTEFYINDELFKTGTCGVAKNYWNISTLKIGEHKLKLVATTIDGEYTAEKVWTVTITESNYKMIEFTKTGCQGAFTAVDRANTDNNKNAWNSIIGNNEATMYNYAFNSNSGWVDDYLLSTGNNYSIINAKPLANNCPNGFTIDVQFFSKDIGDSNAEVLNLYDDVNDCGFKITYNKILLKSKSGNKIELDYSNDTLVSVVAQIDRIDKVAKIFIDGILTEAFLLSDYTAENGTKVLEDFTVNKEIIIGNKDNNGWSGIRNIRYYDMVLNLDEVNNNMLANITDKMDQLNKKEFQNGDTLPTLTISGDFYGISKNDKVNCRINYNPVDQGLYGTPLENIDGTVQWQGTSSLSYPVKNYKIKLKTNQEGEKIKYNPFKDGVEEGTFTLKADYMESTHCHNTGIAKFINRYLYQGITRNPAYQQNNKLRETINGFPCRLILKNTGTSQLQAGRTEPGPGATKDMGIFNFNLDKGCVDTFGLNTELFPECKSYEVVANSDTSAGAFVKYTGDGGNDEELKYLQDSFELRYPDTDDVGEDYGYLGEGLKRIVDKVSDWDVSTSEGIAQMKREFPSYFDVNYTIRYLCCVYLLGMVDNLGKNMMLDTWDGKIWYPRFYDLDTVLSFNNSGLITIPVDGEMEVGIFNTSNSQLWTKLRIAYASEIESHYNYMRNNGFTAENLIKFLWDEQISKIPEAYYNKDADVKYLQNTSELNKLHGSNYHQMKKWITERFLYIDTLFNYHSSTNEHIQIRANTIDLMTFKILTYQPMYFRISWKNGVVTKYKCDGVNPITVTGQVDAATDQEVMIYGASNIKTIEGISSANPSMLRLSSATRLTRLDIQNANQLIDIDGGATLTNLRFLNYINLKGCSSLSGALLANYSPLVGYINIEDTLINDIQIAQGTNNLEEIWYSKSVNTISLSSLPKLKIVGLEIGHSVKEMSLIDCPNIEAFGDRELDNSTQIYKYKNSRWLSGLKNVYLDNSCLSFKEWEMLECVGLESITIKNTPTMTKLLLGCSKKERLKDHWNGEYTTNKLFDYFITPVYMDSLSDIVINTETNTGIKDIIVTTIGRKSYNEAQGFKDKYVAGDTLHGMYANTFDISKTKVTSLKILCNSDINKLMLPSTLTEFIVDTSYDIEFLDWTNWDWNYKYASNFDKVHQATSKEFVGQWDITPGRQNGMHYTGCCGSNIWKVWCPDCCEEPDNLVDSSNNVIAYTWDLTGMKFSDFWLSEMNICYIPWRLNSDGSETIYVEVTPSIKSPLYKIQVQNLNVKCTKHPILSYASTFYTEQPFINSNIDYSGLPKDYKYWSLALAYKNSDECNLVLPSKIPTGSYADCLLWGCNISELRWDDEFILKYLNEYGVKCINTNNITLSEQTSYEGSNVVIEWETTNGNGYGEGRGVFYQSNLKYIKSLTIHQENCYSLIGTAVSYGDINTDLKIIGDLILPNVTNCDGMFGKTLIEEVRNLVLGKPCSTNSMFNQTQLNTITIEGESTNCGSMFTGCKFKNLDLSKFSIGGICSSMFYNSECLDKDLVLSGSIKETASMFHNAKFKSLDLTQVIKYQCTKMGNMFYGVTLTNGIKGFTQIPNSVIECYSIYQNATIGGDNELAFLSESSNATSTTNMFYNTKGSAKLPSTLIVPSSVTNVQGMLNSVTCTLPDELTVDLSRCILQSDNGVLLFGTTNIKHVILKLPRMFMNSRGTAESLRGMGGGLPGYSNATPNFTSIELDYSAFEGTTIGLSQVFGYLYQSIVFKGIDFDLFGYSKIVSTDDTRIYLEDFTTHGACTSRDIEAWYFRMSFENTKRFIRENCGQTNTTRTIALSRYKGIGSTTINLFTEDELAELVSIGNALNWNVVFK